jgi:hypothetical protein
MDSHSKDLTPAINFAQHNFDNLQAIIRSSDTKAGVNVTIMIFLAASAMQISKDAVGKLHGHPALVGLSSTLFVLAILGLLVSVVWSFVVVHRVLLPRGARYTTSRKGHDLMWQEHILLHGDNDVYFAAVRAASQEILLKNLTDQSYELAHISKEKMNALAAGRWLSWVGFCSWVVLLGTGVILK